MTHHSAHPTVGSRSEPYRIQRTPRHQRRRWRRVRGRHRATDRRSHRLLRRGIVVAAFVAIIVWHQQEQFTAATFMFVSVSGVLLFILATAARSQSWAHVRTPTGRVVAVVPVYNEEPGLLHACIDSLLAQTRPLDAIYVVDDGSDEPAPVYVHPLVHWMRTENRGKRHAQITGLGDEIYRARFVVTVDSDSVAAPDAVEKLLRTFGDRRTMAATALPVLRNRTRNLITRVTDMEMVYGCLTIRRAKSALGAVCPTAGTLSVYRAELFADHVGDYLTSGTYSDDRRMSHYALLRGRVVSVDDAIVETNMPTTPAGVFRQRLRWFKGAWRYLPWEVRNLRGTPLALRVWNAAVFVAYPVAILHAVAVMPALGHGVNWWPLGYWLTLLYVQAATYIIGRPGVPVWERIVSWLLLTPALSLFQLLLVRPAMYWAVTQTRTTNWVTRGRSRRRHRVPEPAEDPATEPIPMLMEAA